MHAVDSATEEMGDTLIFGSDPLDPHVHVSLMALEAALCYYNLAFEEDTKEQAAATKGYNALLARPFEILEDGKLLLWNSEGKRQYAVSGEACKVHFGKWCASYGRGGMPSCYHFRAFKLVRIAQQFECM